MAGWMDNYYYLLLLLIFCVVLGWSSMPQRANITTWTSASHQRVDVSCWPSESQSVMTCDILLNSCYC